MHPTLAPFLLSLFGGATAHSWVTLVGTDGRSRGGITHREGELFLQRYVCPLATLEQCQAAIDPKHGITLSDDAMRPCRQDRVSEPMARVAPGEPFSVAWMGNGHAGNGQSDGTCVRIRLAPFKQSPEWVDFDQIGADCLAYWKYGAEGRITTSAEITLPDGTPEGSYTLHWLWNFTDFWYASCADVEVGPVSSDDGFDGSSPSPSLPPSASDGPDVQKYLQSGCAALADTFCQSYIGTGSYCKSYKTDECGRSVCLAGAFLLPCGTSGPLPSPSPTPLPLPSPPSGTLPLPPPPAASPSPEAPPSTSEPPQLAPEGLYLRSGCAAATARTGSGTSAAAPFATETRTPSSSPAPSSAAARHHHNPRRLSPAARLLHRPLLRLPSRVATMHSSRTSRIRSTRKYSVPTTTPTRSDRWPTLWLA